MTKKLKLKTLTQQCIVYNTFKTFRKKNLHELTQLLQDVNWKFFNYICGTRLFKKGLLEKDSGNTTSNNIIIIPNSENNISCLSEVDLIESVSDFILHVLLKVNNSWEMILEIIQIVGSKLFTSNISLRNKENFKYLYLIFP